MVSATLTTGAYVVGAMPGRDFFGAGSVRHLSAGVSVSCMGCSGFTGVIRKIIYGIDEQKDKFQYGIPHSGHLLFVNEL